MSVKATAERLLALGSGVSGVWVSMTETWCNVGTYTGYGDEAKRRTLGQGRTLLLALKDAEKRHERES